MTGPLQTAPPITFDAGPFGKLDVTGVVSGIGVWQGNPVPGDESTRAALSNGQVFIQKTESWLAVCYQRPFWPPQQLAIVCIKS
jgi:hypothetical protein